MDPQDDTRRRRALYRAAHRGTKEMDWLLGRYAEARLAAMSEAELATFEIVLQRPDPELQAWLMGDRACTEELLAPLIAHIRAFHAIKPVKA